MLTIYKYTAKDINGYEVPLSRYEGKVALIVNTATHCGFTSQYKELQNLYLTYNKQGFEILDFPSKQFANQAPESDDGIASFCEINYKTTFHRFANLPGGMDGVNT